MKGVGEMPDKYLGRWCIWRDIKADFEKLEKIETEYEISEDGEGSR
jgi:hypothetical protein